MVPTGASRGFFLVAGTAQMNREVEWVVLCACQTSASRMPQNTQEYGVMILILTRHFEQCPNHAPRKQAGPRKLLGVRSVDWPRWAWSGIKDGRCVGQSRAHHPIAQARLAPSFQIVNPKPLVTLRPLQACSRCTPVRSRL